MADELQQGSSRKILTIPNLLSAFRLVLAGVFAAVYLHAKTRQDYHIAVGILMLSGITDCADGKIARHFHMISELGKILDPIADKLTQAVVAGQNDGAMLCGKITTCYLYGMMALLLLFSDIPTGISTGLILIGTGLLIWSLISYLLKFHRMVREAAGT